MSKELDDFLKSTNKIFGEGTVTRIGDKTRVKIETLNSGSFLLDEALGGGYPYGRIIEIYGAESSGKTTLTLHALAEAQKKGQTCGFIDAEHALDLDYAEKLGVKVDDLIVNQPDNGEQALELLDKMIESNLFQVVIVDSVAALTPKKELEGEMGDSVMGLHARLMSQAMRKITGKIQKSNCIVIFINQTREKIGVMFGNPTTTTGGNALKFYASQRLEITKSSQIKEGEQVIGHQVKIKVVKNKIAPPFKVAETKILYGEGISLIDEIIDIAVAQNIIKKSGSWYSYGESKLGQGSSSVKALLKDNPELVDEILLKLTADE